MKKNVIIAFLSFEFFLLTINSVLASSTGITETFEDNLKSMKPLIPMQNLNHDLDLSEKNVTLEVFTKLTPDPSQIVSLNLVAAAVSHDVYPLIAKLSNLRKLDLSDVISCNDQAMPYIGSLKKLKVLSLNHTKVVSNLEIFGSHPTLKKLNLGCTYTGDEGIKKVSGNKTIEELDVRACDLTDNSLSLFLTFPALKKLNIADNNFTENGLRTFSAEAKARGINVIL